LWLHLPVRDLILSLFRVGSCHLGRQELPHHLCFSLHSVTSARSRAPLFFLPLGPATAVANSLPTFPTQEVINRPPEHSRWGTEPPELQKGCTVPASSSWWPLLDPPDAGSPDRSGEPLRPSRRALGQRGLSLWAKQSRARPHGPWAAGLRARFDPAARLSFSISVSYI
jgi:hypothetical protein